MCGNVKRRYNTNALFAEGTLDLYGIIGDYNKKLYNYHFTLLKLVVCKKRGMTCNRITLSIVNQGGHDEI